jgi:hypothetical protein
MLLTSLLSTTFEQLGMNPNGNEVSIDHLIKYVRHRSKPIGMIQMRNPADQAIQFVKPPGYFDSVMILVVLPDRVGILLEEDGNMMIQTGSLPEAVRVRWNSAGIVEPKKRPMPGMEDKMPVVIGQPAFQREFDKPLAAAQAPPAPPVMVSQARRPQQEEPVAQVSLAPPAVPLQARRRPQMGMEESSMPATQSYLPSVQPSLPSVQPSLPSVQPSLPAAQPSVLAMKNSIRKPRMGNV